MSYVNAKIEMLEHSKAKVDLYRRYLAVYLNILSRVSFVEKIFIFDLLAGEGKDIKGSKGSPLIAIEVLVNHCNQNENCPQIEIWFNDLNMSEIDPTRSKIDRVKKFISSITIPNVVIVKYFRENFNDILPKAINAISTSSNSTGLFFIDPYGYKYIDPNDLKNILSVRNTEILLFLPISPMYRFATQSLASHSPGSMPLRKFLTTLFEKEKPNFSSPYDFISKLKSKLREFIGGELYIPTFYLERDNKNVYCLFFFTTHKKGCEIMLEAKWKMDKQGIGYKKDNAPMLFSPLELSNYPEILKKFISSKDGCTNHDIYKFGLENDFLPKHSNIVIKNLIDNHVIERSSLDSKLARGNYLKFNSERTVLFKIKRTDNG